MAPRRIAFSKAAEADLDRLAAFIASGSPARAARAIARLREGIKPLADFPELGVKAAEQARHLFIRSGKSGYVVRYQILDDVILITRIWHGKEGRLR
ncbi:MAG: type II toxin-antitoxin system RelE/ParE family toxin [Hyphomonadaceae bacterium]